MSTLNRYGGAIRLAVLWPLVVAMAHTDIPHVLAISSHSFALCPALFVTPSPERDEQSGKLDANGVIRHDYGSSYGGAGLQYSPGPIFSYGMSLWYSECAGGLSSRTRARLLAQVSWMRSAAVYRHGAAVWLYRFPNPRFGANGYWISAFAQGLALSLLIRADQVDPQPWHRALGERVLRSFELSVEQGGVRHTDAAGVVYEGVAFPRAHSAILNEGLLALYGLYEWAHVYGSSRALRLFQQGISGIVARLPRYDAGWISYYDLLGHIATEGQYNALQAKELAIFAKLTGRQELASYSRLFSGYETSLPFSATASAAVDPVHYGAKNLVFTTDPQRTYWSAFLPCTLTLDLAQPRHILAVVLRDETPVSRPTLLSIQTSLNGKVWSQSRTFSLSWVNELGKAGIPLRVRARYIRLQPLRQAGNFVALNYLVVKGTTQPIISSAG